MFVVLAIMFTVANASESTSNDSILINTMTNDEVGGQCGCYYNFNKREGDLSTFIYYQEITNQGYGPIKMKRNNRLLNFKFVSESQGTTIVKNNEYQIIIKLNEIKNCVSNDFTCRSSSHRGNMDVKNLKTGQILSIPFIGDCGC